MKIVMATKVLIYSAVIMFAAVMLSSAAADQPLSAQQLIETTQLKEHLTQLEKGEIVLIKRGKLESNNELHVAMEFHVGQWLVGHVGRELDGSLIPRRLMTLGDNESRRFQRTFSLPAIPVGGVRHFVRAKQRRQN